MQIFHASAPLTFVSRCKISKIYLTVQVCINFMPYLYFDTLYISNANRVMVTLKAAWLYNVVSIYMWTKTCYKKRYIRSFILFNIIL